MAELVGAVELDGLALTGDRTATQAGAFALFGVPTCTLADLLVEGNGSTEGGIYAAGGGALLASSSGTITTSTFTGNDAFDGAALVVEQSDVTMSGVDSRGNTVVGWGGGILAIASGGDSHVTADATTVVSDNHADAGHGGAWPEGPATLVSTATAWGGAGQENLPEDLVVSGTSLPAPGTDFTCDAATAACTP